MRKKAYDLYLVCLLLVFRLPKGSRSPTVGVGGRNGATSSHPHDRPTLDLHLLLTFRPPPHSLWFDKQHTRSYARKRYDMTTSIAHREQQRANEDVGH
ncbi:hypothetical protein HD553DRAFT_311122 [Filobasidium floriforme]|uniref:uncharacterized protein n=1 Tax=Filobasidium floriforme TaxID=5210 RepID=UPI001E8D3BE1|nr:uncharacterized protein HD553DRAFT_311122 [Filobasidium floriforme]KAH8085369.1 hypothetical protein HD553DRAFT_311122 [Filobasidium floriforme]